jgi:hypothetical protein
VRSEVALRAAPPASPADAAAPNTRPTPTPKGFNALNTRMAGQESVMPRANRIFFLSIPPNVFLDAAGNAADFASSK